MAGHFKHPPRNEVERQAMPLVIAWEDAELTHWDSLPSEVEGMIFVIDKRIALLRDALSRSQAKEKS